RDRLMTRLGLAYPGYGFERHMGYSVPEHFAALARLGPTIHHRKSFAPVAAKLAALGGASDEAVAELVALLPAFSIAARFRSITRWGPMHYVSLLIEFLRGRPAVVFWTVALVQAALWTLMPALFYSAPPGDVPLLLAIGRELVLGSYLGPPLS